MFRNVLFIGVICLMASEVRRIPAGTSIILMGVLQRSSGQAETIFHSEPQPGQHIRKPPGDATSERRSTALSSQWISSSRTLLLRSAGVFRLGRQWSTSVRIFDDMGSDWAVRERWRVGGRFRHTYRLHCPRLPHQYGGYTTDLNWDRFRWKSPFCSAWSWLSFQPLCE